MREQIDKTMGFHPGNPSVAPVYEDLRAKFIALAHHVDHTCPDGRVKSLAITHLEESLMRAIQSIAIEEPLGPERGRT